MCVFVHYVYTSNEPTHTDTHVLFRLQDVNSALALVFPQLIKCIQCICMYLGSRLTRARRSVLFSMALPNMVANHE